MYIPRRLVFAVIIDQGKSRAVFYTCKSIKLIITIEIVFHGIDFFVSGKFKKDC